MPDGSRVRNPITPRRLQWDFQQQGPRYWFNGSAALTHMLNVYTLLVPDNERYYIRILQRCLAKLEDPAQKREVYAFFRQEMLHSQAHGKYWQNLKAAGLPVDRFTRVVGTVLYGIVEPLLPLRAHVAIVAAIEHINAYLGHIFLRRQLLRSADPQLRRLFEWHFAEEIEHKAVAHNVLTAAFPGYVTRLAGGLLAFPLFYSTMFCGLLYLLACDRQLCRRSTFRDLYAFLWKDGVAAESLRHMWRYLRPGFHPDELPDDYLAEAVLAGELTAPWPRSVPGNPALPIHTRSAA